MTCCFKTYTLHLLHALACIDKVASTHGYDVVIGHHGLEDAVQAACRRTVFLCGCIGVSVTKLVLETLRKMRVAFPAQCCAKKWNGDVRVAVDASAESVADSVLHRTVSFDKRYLEKENVYAFDGIVKKGKDPYFGHQEYFKENFADLLSQVHTFSEVRKWSLEPKDIILSMMSSYGSLTTHLMFLKEDVSICKQSKYLDCITDDLGNVTVHLFHLSCIYQIYLPSHGVDPNDKPFSSSPNYEGFDYGSNDEDVEEKFSAV